MSHEIIEFDPDIHTALRWSVYKHGIQQKRAYHSEFTAWKNIIGARNNALNDPVQLEHLKEKKRLEGFDVKPSSWEPKFHHQAVINATKSTENFQSRVKSWVETCFGEEVAADKIERNHRFLEEALELVQSIGCTMDEAHQLVDYVFNRPVGDPPQEVGGVMITLAALCAANDLDMQNAGEIELARVWTKVEQIRAKQAAKPKNSPLAE